MYIADIVPGGLVVGFAFMPAVGTVRGVAGIPTGRGSKSTSRS